MGLFTNLGMAALVLLAAAPSDDVVARSIDDFVDVCVHGSGTFARGELHQIKFHELPPPFQRYFQEHKDGGYFHFSHAPERYLISYRTGWHSRGATGEVCAFAIEKVSIPEGRSAVRDRIHFGDSKPPPPSAKQVVDYDPDGKFSISYFYLQSRNLANNQSIGPRFLVLQTSIFN